MKYQHILVALELSEESKVLIERADSMAKLYNADVSFIHIDGTHGEIYPEITDLKENDTATPLNQEKMEQLYQLQNYLDHPLKKLLVGTGDLSDKLNDVIQEHNVDLLLCGHHADFWSKIVSYSRSLINRSPIDILVVPIK